MNTVATAATGTAPLVVHFMKLSDDAVVPTRSSPAAAGWDLCSADDDKIVIRAQETALIGTRLRLALPKKCYGRIAPRSGLACKHSLDVGAGVVDRDYRGEVKVLLFNFGTEDYVVRKGDRIAQLILERIYDDDVCFRGVDRLDDTDRNSAGFGSTGYR